MHGQNLSGEATIHTLHCDRWIQTSDQNFEKNKRAVTLFQDKKMIQKDASSQTLKKIIAKIGIRCMHTKLRWSTFEAFISTPVLCYIPLQLPVHLWVGPAKIKLLNLLYLVIV